MVRSRSFVHLFPGVGRAAAMLPASAVLEVQVVRKPGLAAAVGSARTMDDPVSQEPRDRNGAWHQW
jgi:hypothetical protein